MGGETKLTPANYPEVIAALFRSDDLDSWYQASSDGVRQAYKKTIQKEYERYTTLPNERTPEQFQKFVDFFNYGLKSGQNKF